MTRYTKAREADTPDQLWIVEHPDVFTAGARTRTEHLPQSKLIPVVRTDRGGQITWHGPGQLVVYLLLDLRRRRMGVHALVRAIEQSVIDLLAEWGIGAQRRDGAPGVYVGDKKIAALGLKVHRGACYHGLSLNVDPDLSAFEHIDPCGYPGMAVTSLHALGKQMSCADCADALLRILSGHLGYEEISWQSYLPEPLRSILT
jgi:lipoyl(octanoyl) transferase